MSFTRERPLVTVVIPTLNSGRFLEEAIGSVLSQDYEALECWVVDGGSTDRTLEILRAHAGRIQWVSEPDRGQAHAINKGFALARGEVLSWLNADDRYLPGAVSRAVGCLLSHPELAAVYGDVEWIDEHGRVLELRRSMPFDLHRLLNYYNYIPQMGTFFWREALEEVGGLDEALQYAMDYDLWIRMGKRRSMGYMGCVLAQWRIHKGSKTSSSPLVAMPENLAVSRRHGGMRLSPMRLSALLWRMGAAGAVRLGRRLLERRWRRGTP